MAVAPLMVPVGPLAMATDTTTPDWATVVPLESSSCATGCCARATPLCALPDGAVARTSFVDKAPVTANGPLVTDSVPVVATSV